MNRFALATAALLATGTVPSMAQEAQCFQNESFLVIAQERTEDVGTDLLVRPAAKGKIACTYVEEEGDFIVNRNGDPLWFEGLLGNFLILTKSTGPDGNLVIIDLEAESLFLDEWVDDDIVLEENTVTFWQRFEDGDAANCPGYADYTANGLGSVIAREQIFDAIDGTVRGTGAERCSATQ